MAGVDGRGATVIAIAMAVGCWLLAAGLPPDRAAVFHEGCTQEERRLIGDTTVGGGG
jgi:hypothetical protein